MWATNARHRSLEACSLLTAADASVALGASSVAGKRQMAADSAGCVWSDDPEARDSSRRLVLNLHSLSAYGIAGQPKMGMPIVIEPIAGIGDDAFYQMYPKDSPPFIWFKKGKTGVSIRIIIGTKPYPFTVALQKAKLAVLAKAAAAKL
jgi:hypothetical protein